MRSIAAVIGFVLALGVVDRGVAHAGTEFDYCRDNARADRVDCNANYLAFVASCLSQFAFDKWAANDAEDLRDADADLLDCKADALADRIWCRSLIDTCVEE